ncbi:P-loop containing nucleoside triphosphate hydrolase protein [Tribonema minus]|uniref:Kinesin-like protein n=1 Tax=Tribonema minus TaxID=303371 RepID=A0A835YYJ9_9STRA|nr:P-loop containing nucleoside triphosphate hydrolase protein [Tribonema minus]
MLKSLVPPRLPARTPTATPSPASQRRGSGGSASVASNNTFSDATPLNSSTAGGRRSSNSVERSIQVCVRIRPLNHREMQMQGHDRPSWRWDNDKIVQNVVPGTEKTSNNTAQLAGFEFDHLFYPDSLTQDIYEKAVKGVVLRTMEGYHGSVLAYGQTSTGKTFTMGGVGTQPGVIPLAVEECFGYVAIYNEQINDLLCPASTNVRIVSDKRDGVAVVGNKSEVVISPQQVYALISAGEAQRHIGATDANKNSSRSHTIFRMTIESRARDGGSGKQRSRVSTLSLVDLAGSESAKLSNTRGERQLEGAFINRSLLTLGHIIYKLTEEDRSGRANEDFQKHLPYRDSKLTRLLQPSLGGNAQIAIICTVSPAAANVEETRNTLKFASRAKRMRNTARVSQP